MDPHASPRRAKRGIVVVAVAVGGLIAVLAMCGAVSAAVANVDDSLLGTWVVIMVVALLGEGVLIGIALGDPVRPGPTRSGTERTPDASSRRVARDASAAAMATREHG